MSTLPGNCDHGTLRLAEPFDDEVSRTREGRVEICINNAWGTVCETGFSLPDANVTCEQLVGFQTEGE